MVIQNYGQSRSGKSTSVQEDITFSLLDSIDIINKTTYGEEKVVDDGKKKKIVIDEA